MTVKTKVPSSQEVNAGQASEVLLVEVLIGHGKFTS